MRVSVEGSLGFVARVFRLESLGTLLFDLVSSQRCEGIGTTRKGEMESRVYHRLLSVISSASDSWASSYFSPRENCERQKSNK